MPSQRAPNRGLAGDPPTSAQDVAGDCQLMGGCANVPRCVMENEVLEIDEFAVDPQRGAGIGEILTLEEARADRGSGNALVETGQRDTGVKSRPHQGCHADFREIVSH